VNFGNPSLQGTILNRGASLWSSTATPTLGQNGGTGGSLTLQGSTSGSAAIGVKAAAGSTTFNLPVGNGSVNNVLITDGSGNTSWVSAGSGTVSSVGMTVPNILSVTPSSITSTGTFAVSLANENANLVFSGPTTGGAATPTFRSLVGADLPNPSASTLGGTQSAAAVSHQWINTISTSGVPGLTQPAFTDISGVITAAQCPNPSASTIGCVESYVAVAHQWINAVSTAGVHSSTQPNFTDLAGAATLAQLPSISNNSVLANNSGGTAIPSALSASQILDMINNVQGDILYRGASGWSSLAPGTSGQVLTTAGASANPSWATVSGTGTVTNIATNNGLTGGPITTTGTIGLTPIAPGDVLANVTGGTAVPIPNTPSSVLDVIGSATGDTLYRTSGSGWQVLAPGSNGQVLTMGASTPAWANSGTLTDVTISAGAGISVTGTCNITTTGTCTVAQSLGNATVQSNGSSSNSGSTSYIMSGLGSGCHITPTYSGRVLLVLSGTIANNTASDAFQYQLRYGTGSAPAAGATGSPGTQVGITIPGGGGAANANVSFPLSISGIVTGLTPGTAYWFDANYESIVGGTTSLSTGCSAMEF
jgi:hypothetical protein